MAIMETGRLLSALNQSEIIARQMIVNNVMQSEECSFCIKRKAGQLPYLQEIERVYGNLNTVEVPVFTNEIKGLDALYELKKVLFGEETILKTPDGNDQDKG
jgi:arsenite/tail-anchored protein-transporting ATPase